MRAVKVYQHGARIPTACGLDGLPVRYKSRASGVACVVCKACFSSYLPPFLLSSGFALSGPRCVVQDLLTTHPQLVLGFKIRCVPLGVAFM